MEFVAMRRVHRNDTHHEETNDFSKGIGYEPTYSGLKSPTRPLEPTFRNDCQGFVNKAIATHAVRRYGVEFAIVP